METKTSFAIAGLTRSELMNEQLFLNVLRNFPEQAELVVAWLQAIIDSQRSPPDSSGNLYRMAVHASSPEGDRTATDAFYAEPDLVGTRLLQRASPRP